MVDAFSRHTLRVSVAQICQIIGWTSIHSNPLEILTDILQEYIFNLSKIAGNYAMLYGQLEPNINHLALAFKDMGISVCELEEYVTYVETSSVLEVPKYPLPKESYLNHLKPGSREVVTRPVHIHEHLPPMHPHLEDRDYAQNKSPLSIDVQSSDSLSPLSSPKSIFKKPGDPICSDNRRGRSLIDDNEGRPLREISSVMMTTSGFLSPAREGKLPEARTQPIEFNRNSLSPDDTNLNEQNIEMKSEKKKKPKTTDVKKFDKENKVKDEIFDQKETEDEFKSKKLVNIKETSKLKSLKGGGQKITHKPPSPSPVQKKPKVQAPPASYQANPVLKQPKERSPKNDKKALSPIKETFFSSLPIPFKELHSDIDVKLPSEPDKQKLNILKKISKVKEEHEHDDSKNSFPEWRENNSFPVYQAPHLGSNKKISNENSNFSKEFDDEIDAQIDVENPSPTSIFEFNRLSNSDLPKSTEQQHSKVPEVKKKKKEKKEKRESDKMDIDKDIFYNSIKRPHLDDNFGKLKHISSSEVTSTTDDDIQTPVFPSLTCPVSPGPGLIPWNNPLFPNSNPISPTMNLMNYSNFPKKSQDTPTSLQQSSFSSTFSNTSQSTPGPAPLPSFPNKDNNLILAKKKERKREKKLKDKIKKKKEKKEKNRPKDKSERKKLKMEKKEKAKLKLKKEKKERKKEKELANEERQEMSTVPKITFKLGPVSPKDSTTEPCTRKIVIKPVVKKDEIEAPDTSSFVPELPKPQISSSTPKLKSLKGGKPHLQVKPEAVEKPILLNCVPPLSVPKPEPISSITKWDGDTNQLWICPACSRPDDGSPMIACDLCDYWYHWTCVGIHEAIENDWYCQSCTLRREDGGNEKKKKHRKKKT